jgi:hypothetical protein
VVEEYFAHHVGDVAKYFRVKEEYRLAKNISRAINSLEIFFRQ